LVIQIPKSILIYSYSELNDQYRPIPVDQLLQLNGRCKA